MTITTHLNIKKPLIVFDLETTGLDVDTARIVQLAYVKLTPDRCDGKQVYYFNPGIPILQDATDIHGITDERVQNEPSFEGKADTLWRVFQGCDLAGYNVEKFDLPILRNEFKRAGINETTSIGASAVIDVMTICHKNEKRDLTWAVKFYKGCDFTKAHDASEDALATLAVLEAQIEKYDLSTEVENLHTYCHEKPENFVDSEGKLLKQNGEIILGFGKMKGKPLKEVAKLDQGFLQWILRNNFSDEVKNIVRGSLNAQGV